MMDDWKGFGNMAILAQLVRRWAQGSSALLCDWVPIHI